MKPLAYMLSAVLLAFPGSFAFAQAEGDNAQVECTSSPTEIMTLNEPVFETLSVWDTLYATKDGMDVFSDALPVSGGAVVAAGSYTADKKDLLYHPLLVKFDEHRKVVWEMREKTTSQQTIHRILPTKDGFFVLGDVADGDKGNGIYTRRYAADGKGADIAPLFEDGFDLDAKGMVAAQDATGYMIAVQAVSKKDGYTQKGMLFKVDQNGGLTWKRSFTSGRSTVINNVQATLDRGYVLTGQIVVDEKRSGGWVIVLDGNGAIKWQRNYPRGTAASFQAAAQTADGGFILSGKARPSGARGKQLAAWVMRTDSGGAPQWQRYFRGDYSYEAPDLIVYHDGRSSVLLNGRGMDGAHRSHARLVTLSPLGAVQKIENFTDGHNATAAKLVSGTEAERIIAGYAQGGFGENQADNLPESAPSYTYDGWLIAGVPLDLYEDPCDNPPEMSPILP